MTIHWWKLNRELQRIKQQVRSIPEFFFEPSKRSAYDTNRSRQLIQSTGTGAPSSKVALLLLYQPAGVSASTLWTCEHLVSKGYAPLVVSNAPLSAEDKERLLAVCWRVVERPNFGYDFGGYRDGIWLLQQWQIDIEKLIILNDSIWFPLNGNEVLIEQMEAAPADVVGALQLDPLRQTEGVPTKKRPFFGSFFLMIKQAAWRHPAFSNFWETYRITSNKYQTIRRGERGFSHAMMDAGLTCRAIYTRRALDKYIHSQGNEMLRDLLSDLVCVDEKVMEQIRLAVVQYSDTETWRSLGLSLATQATEKQNILATAPIASLTQFQVPYLKKARDKNNLEALRVIRQRMQQGALPTAHPIVLQEIDKLLNLQGQAVK